MIENNKTTVEDNNDAAIEALTFEDLNEVSLPMDVQEPLLKTIPSLDQPSFIE